jgi:Fe-S-cluster formation regulator IscX/YfhJ
MWSIVCACACVLTYQWFIFRRIQKIKLETEVLIKLETEVLSQEITRRLKVGEELLLNLEYVIKAPLESVTFSDYLKHFSALDRLYSGFDDLHEKLINIPELDEDSKNCESVLLAIDVCRTVLQRRIDIWHIYTKQKKDEFFS